MAYDIVGVGNALVDIQTQVEDAFLESLGFAKGAMTLADPQTQSKILENLPKESIKISSGGSAANTIHGISVLGGRTYYIGKVADDDYGKHYTNDMKVCGVGFPSPQAGTQGTGTSVVLITPDSQRTMITHLGVSAELVADNLDEEIIKSAKMIYIEGYLWTGKKSQAAAIKMANIAKDNKIPVAFTLSDAFVVDGFKESLTQFIKENINILFCNEVEAKALTSEPTPLLAANKLSDYVETVFLTMSKKGSLVSNKKQDLIETKPFLTTPVDTTGAGDLYAAGALYSLLNEYSLEEAGIIGSYCAGQVVTQLGARMPVNSHNNVEKILEEYKKLS
jgi:sugar/nucleoside kinase (ribokinase family)